MSSVERQVVLRIIERNPAHSKEWIKQAVRGQLRPGRVSAILEDLVELDAVMTAGGGYHINEYGRKLLMAGGVVGNRGASAERGLAVE